MLKPQAVVNQRRSDGTATEIGWSLTEDQNGVSYFEGQFEVINLETQQQQLSNEMVVKSIPLRKDSVCLSDLSEEN